MLVGKIWGRSQRSQFLDLVVPWSSPPILSLGFSGLTVLVQSYRKLESENGVRQSWAREAGQV